ncbi:hypothetical protein ES677_05225 [Bizionia gelidisalsuginis]|uniref:Uncharacterized protein n=1 Tax=Bizionia gelidisalsuginis TaxID=291188 RepID=A0ABY3MC37_9FLAO|nr:hypothetical protein [Bizionia gelidisalsuginis]TYC14783.1 hypothetical protein ES677_05225 [Bizionia gelidisalsuginis]
MNKYIYIIIILISCRIIAQDTEIIIIDRFDSNKNNWNFKSSDNWNCDIKNGKLNMQINKTYRNIWLIANGIDNLANKTYTEITYDFDIENTENNDFGTGMIFINDLNSKEFENVSLVLNKENSYFVKKSDSYPDAYFNLALEKSPIFKNKGNTAKIIFDNRETADKESQIKVFINEKLIIKSNWNISNFNKIGFITYGGTKITYDNLVIKQENKTAYVVDAFDFISLNGNLKMDNNGIDKKTLIEYIPVEIIDNQNILSTKDLIKSLKKNIKCSGIETRKVNFKGQKREMFSFNYGNSLIEFFTDTEKPNPIEINFLEKDDLDDFFKIYADYHSYRYDENRAQWPSNPWFSILKFNDSYRATIWRGM